MSKLKPIGDKILIEPLEPETVSKGGIVLPDTAKEKPQEGKVLAVGEGKYIDGKLVPLTVKPGQKVIFAKYGGDEIKVNDKELKIITESDILAIMEDK